MDKKTFLAGPNEVSTPVDILQFCKHAETCHQPVPCTRIIFRIVEVEPSDYFCTIDTKFKEPVILDNHTEIWVIADQTGQNGQSAVVILFRTLLFRGRSTKSPIAWQSPTFPPKHNCDENCTIFFSLQ